MLVVRKHLIFICFIGQQALQFIRHTIACKLIGYTFFDNLFAGDNIDERKMLDGEEERLRPPDERYQR